MTQTSTIAALTALATDITVGPLGMRVDQAVTAEGNATVSGISEQTDDAPEGLAYVLAQVTATNNGSVAVPLAASDFAFSGTDGVLRRCPSMKLPDPPFDALLAPGDSFTGWTAAWVNDTSSVIMLFDPSISCGTRFSAAFALTDGATIPVSEPAGDTNDAGVDIDSPASMGDAVRTAEWGVQVNDVIDVSAYFDMSDYRVQALGRPDETGWGDLGTAIGISVTIQNRANRPRFFSWTALELVDTNGEAWDHLLAMTQPRPPASLELLPGASWTGWYGILVLPWATNRLLRFQESRLSDDPRYISLDGSNGSSSQANNSSSERSGSQDPLSVESGDVVEVTEDAVNIRTDGTSAADIVAEAHQGDQLVITGDPVVADGYRWYPVEAVDGDAAGFIVQDFIAPVTD